MNQEQKIQEVIRYIQDANPKAEFIEGHDNAILGIATVPQLGECVAYSSALIVNNLFNDYMDDESYEWESEEEAGMSKNDQAWQMALDFYGHSIYSVSYGEYGPIFIDDFF
jgi:hypothetical protein